MRLQYLGNAKDSFKWDYHDFLVAELQYPLLNIALMMRPDAGGNDEKSDRPLFPARIEIIDFCQNLRERQSIDSIKVLPKKTGASYQVEFHQNSKLINNENRADYFSSINGVVDQVFFLDPDTGFEPGKLEENHVAYNDVSCILEQLSQNSVVTVFQNFRRKSFPDDFATIQERLLPGYATAIYWHSLMFVAISKNKNVIKQVATANQKYAATNPVNAIA